MGREGVGEGDGSEGVGVGVEVGEQLKLRDGVWDSVVEVVVDRWELGLGVCVTVLRVREGLEDVLLRKTEWCSKGGSGARHNGERDCWEFPTALKLDTPLTTMMATEIEHHQKNLNTSTVKTPHHNNTTHHNTTQTQTQTRHDTTRHNTTRHDTT